MKKHKRPFGIMQLFLAMERDLIVGGQAVMEGVMMRTPSAYAIACRKKDGTIVHTAEKLPKWSDKYKWMNLPVLRGGATLIQSMALGIKALNFSARDLRGRFGSRRKSESQRIANGSRFSRRHDGRKFYESTGQDNYAGRNRKRKKPIKSLRRRRARSVRSFSRSVLTFCFLSSRRFF